MNKILLLFSLIVLASCEKHEFEVDERECYNHLGQLIDCDDCSQQTGCIEVHPE